MKSKKLYILFSLCLLIAFILCRNLTPVHYQSPEVSATIVDADTGKPIKDATVQVRWSASLPKGWEGSFFYNLHTSTTTTDTNGMFSISAWGPVALARNWHYYEFDPTVSFSKLGYKSAYKGNDINQDSVTTHALPFVTVTLDRPSWNGERLPLKSIK
jgi:hypothetical protein